MLMVSPKGGSLSGTTALPPWHQAQVTWGRSLSVNTPVGSAWVEWTSDELLGGQVCPTDPQEAPVPSNPSDKDQGPTLLAKGQARKIYIHFYDESCANMARMKPSKWEQIKASYYPATLSFSYDGTNMEIVQPAASGTNGVHSVGVSTYDVPGIALVLHGTAETTDPLNPNHLALKITYADGRPKPFHAYNVVVFDAGMAVDYNRDGQIQFTGDSDNPNDVDSPRCDKPFEFWVNDNYDYPKEPDGGDPADAAYYQDEEQDRPKPKQKLADGSEVVVPGSLPDCDLNHPTVERDLEDFTRLQIKLPKDLGPIASKVQYSLCFRGTENATIKLFESVDRTGSDSYLNDANAAHGQLGGKYLCLVTRAYATGQTSVLDVSNPNDQRVLPYLFEAVTAGQGKLVLDVTYDKTTLLARYPVRMDLKPMSDLLEEYSVGDTQEQEPAQQATPLNTLANPQSGDDANYILWVHGWNWEDWQKKAYGYSTFKRLYWLGYKGSFGIYKWPGTYGTTAALRFDESERHALLSGEGLKKLIMGLKGRGFKVHMYAHSQGCMVTSEALRQIALDEAIQKPVVESMTFSQAAVSARMYDENYPEYEDWSGLSNRVKAGITVLASLLSPLDQLQAPVIVEAMALCPPRPQWPDLHGHFPYHLEKPGTPERYAPYFQPVKEAVKSDLAGYKMMFNFYNEWDYPTGQYNTDWHLGNWVSGSWLLDQLIKPYRIVSWPLYRDRAYRMVYGGQDLTADEKMKFTRNGTRQDFFCIGSPGWADCGVPTQCHGTPVYDFSLPAIKYEMMAYGGAGYSRTLGGHKPGSEFALDPSSGFVSQHEVNLKLVPYEYREFMMWHGAQFRGTLAKQSPYWTKFLANLSGIAP